VVFRLGRLRSGGAKGPGLFFIMPCVDTYKVSQSFTSVNGLPDMPPPLDRQKVDLRTVSFDVPPQEVSERLPRACVV